MSSNINRTGRALRIAVGITVLAIIFLAGSASALSNSDDWIQNPANGHYYKLTPFMNWIQAEAQAVIWGSHLVTVNDADENAWLVSTFGSSESFLIGYTDKDEEGNWKWLSGEESTYSNWFQHPAGDWEPNNVEPGEDAAAINDIDRNRNEFGPGKWNDLPIGDHYRGIVESSTAISTTPTVTPNFYLHNDFHVGTDNDSLGSGTYYNNVYNYLFLQGGSTVLGDIGFNAHADNIIDVNWQDYTTWNQTSVNWVFPPDYVVLVFNGTETMEVYFETNNSESRYLSVNLGRWMNQTEFTSSGYQLAKFNVTFEDKNFESVWGDINTQSGSGVNASIIPGTLTTDAPINNIDENGDIIRFNFDKDLIQTGVPYNFSILLRVEPTAERTSVTYKPALTITERIYRNSIEGTGTTVEIPAYMLPEHVSYASVTTNLFNSWQINRANHIMGTLDSYIRTTAIGTTFPNAIPLPPSRSDTILQGSYVYYKFYATSGQQATVTLSPASADQNLRVYDPNRNLIGSSSNSGNAIDRYSFVATTSGYYYAAVYGNQAGSYTISVSSTGVAATVTPTPTIAPQELAIPQAEFSLAKNFNVETDNDTLSSGTYHHNIRYDLNINNENDSSDTILGDIRFSAQADGITNDNLWQEYATWNSNSVDWVFPSDYLIQENDGMGVSFEVNHSESRYLNVNMNRWMDKTEFTSTGYQLATFNVTFQDKNFEWVWANINANSWGGVNASIVPGTLTIDAPINNIDERKNYIQLDFDKQGIQTGVTYSFSVIIKVEPTAERTAVIYKPQFSVGEGLYGINSNMRVRGTTVEIPSSMLPEHVSYASATTNISNSWLIQRYNHTIGRLNTLISVANIGNSFSNAINLTGSSSESVAQGGYAYYKVYANSGRQVTVTLSPTSADQNLRVYDPNRNLIGSSSNGGNAVDRYSFATTTSGYYYAVVYGNQAGSYTISVSSTGAAATVTPTPASTPTPTPILTTITVSPSSVSLTSDSTRTFTASPKDQNGNPITAIVTWSSSNPSVGTISNSGVFTARAAGTTTITASSGSVRGTATVTTTVTVTPTATPTPTATATSIPSAGTITRSFSSAIVAPSASLTVTLTPAPATLFSNPGYQVIETVPAGFTVTTNTASGATNVGNVWTFIQIGSAPFTYTITAPSTTSTGIFSGTFKDQLANTGDVSGSSIILAGSRSLGTVTRSKSPSTVLPDGIQTITLTPSPNDIFSSPGYQVIESIPAGFTYLSTTAVGSIQGNVVTLTQLGSSPITYTIRAPSSAGSYAIDGTFKDQLSNLGIVSGQTSLRVGTGYDANGDGRIDRKEAIQAVIDYFSGVITRQDAIDVVILYFQG